ncbi:hypothetical protein E2C01_047980 [Portunus trituberculatus]|uniref:Uncharacterized protein n=1 Tax=Portunus trituberculatus TaxID=210409 RepID=A0A5B7G9Z4_PORTR|nr:hypothetical protein [Portunus trituberculatus]
MLSYRKQTSLSPEGTYSEALLRRWSTTFKTLNEVSRASSFLQPGKAAPGAATLRYTLFSHHDYFQRPKR